MTPCPDGTCRSILKRPGRPGALARALIVLTCLGLASPALSQAADDRYETLLLRLSEILGSIHFLSTLCETQDQPGIWRGQMEALLAAEAAFPQRRRLMTIRFNRGYSSFKQGYRTCTPPAMEALRRYREEGAQITSDLVGQYGQRPR